MYRIMLIKSKRPGEQSLYQFETVDENGTTSVVELETMEDLDAHVELMLNNGYAKSDFIIVKIIDYSITADNYSETE